MRLTPEQIQGIRRTVRQLAGEQAGIRVFGSRLDDPARGGDLDLLLELPAPNLRRLPIHEVAVREGQPL